MSFNLTEIQTIGEEMKNIMNEFQESLDDLALLIENAILENIPYNFLNKKLKKISKKAKLITGKMTAFVNNPELQVFPEVSFNEIRYMIVHSEQFLLNSITKINPTQEDYEHSYDDMEIIMVNIVILDKKA
jgi:uncharacterized radical SAM superfamily protein